MNLRRQRKGKRGRRGVSTQAVGEKIRSIPPWTRRTIREISLNAEIPSTTLFGKLKDLGARQHTRWVKPCLTSAQKETRLRWILDHTAGSGRKIQFMDFRHTLHLDEKWFQAVTDGQKVWILQDEGHVPAPKVQSKLFIKKVMRLAVVGRPHHRPHGTYFDRSVGIWPFVRQTCAQRSSKIRARGTAEINTVTVPGDVWLSLLVEKLFPAIRSAMKHAKTTTVLRMDGAGNHFKRSIHHEISQELTKDGFDIRLEQQPSNSPDLNVLDLGFFHSLQTRVAKIKEGGKLVDILSNVNKAFKEYPPETLERV